MIIHFCLCTFFSFSFFRITITFRIHGIFHLLFRNDGIVIAVTFWQWVVEFIFNILLIGLLAGLGANLKVDNFVALFSLWFGSTVVPSFYFMACAEFRRDLETYGLLKAFWIAITKDNYENYS